MNAMLRLSRWTLYNRRKWTDLTQAFNQVFILFSPGPVRKDDSTPPIQERWQEKLILSGSVVLFSETSGEEITSYPFLTTLPDGSLVPIGACLDEESTPTVECSLKAVPQQSQTQYPEGYNVRLTKGHYSHIHLRRRK